MEASSMQNFKYLFVNLVQRYDCISFCSQNNVSQSFTLFRQSDEIHQIYEILDSFIPLWSLETLKRCKLLISKIMLCMRNEQTVVQLVNQNPYSHKDWTRKILQYKDQSYWS